jgi:hypothetical protein
MIPFEKALVGGWDMFSLPISLFGARRHSNNPRVGSCCSLFLSIILFGYLTYYLASALVTMHEGIKDELITQSKVNNYDISEYNDLKIKEFTFLPSFEIRLQDHRRGHLKELMNQGYDIFEYDDVNYVDEGISINLENL